VIPRVLIDKYQSSEVREDLIRNKCLAWYKKVVAVGEGYENLGRKERGHFEITISLLCKIRF
jgi:hypothetical protein